MYVCIEYTLFSTKPLLFSLFCFGSCYNFHHVYSSESGDCFRSCVPRGCVSEALVINRFHLMYEDDRFDCAGGLG